MFLHFNFLSTFQTPDMVQKKTKCLQNFFFSGFALPYRKGYIMTSNMKIAANLMLMTCIQIQPTCTYVMMIGFHFCFLLILN